MEGWSAALPGAGLRDSPALQHSITPLCSPMIPIPLVLSVW